MTIQPYLHFEGRCEEAIEFYKSAIGAKVQMLMRFKDCPEPQGADQFPPENLNKVMHATLRIGDSIMNVSDGRCQSAPTFTGFALTISVKTETEADQFFGALSEGGTTTMPLSKTFFSPCFGMVKDRFGVHWMVIVQ